MKYILITGGAGFVGSNFIEYLFKCFKDYYIINLDKLTYAGNLKNLEKMNKERYDFFKGDIKDFELVDKIFSKYPVDYIVNFAAESHVDRSLKKPQVFLETNVIGVQNLLDVALKYWKSNLRYKKFIQISTDEVYGDRQGCEPADESTILNPSSPYSASKVGGEMLVKAYGRSYSLPYNIVRSSNNYGPKQHKEKLIPLIIERIMSKNKVPIYGDGKQKRDWIFVEDNCRGIMKILEEGKDREIYNLGTEKLTENIDIFKIIFKELKEKIEIEGNYKDSIEFVEDRLGHDREYRLNCDKIKRELGWKPAVKLEEGLEKTVEWYLKNTEY
jgi:dTDP-glucose 4,6-dehydratase